MSDDDAFFAAAAVVTDAAQRRSTLERLTRELQEKLHTRKAGRKTKHGGTGGRMTKEEQATEDDLKARLLRVNMGLLPGEDLPAQAPSDAVLVASAARHSADHAPPVRRVAAAAAAAAPLNVPAAAAAAVTVALLAAAAAADAAAVAGGDDPDHDDLLEVEGEGEEGAGANGGAAAAAQPAASARSKRKATGKAPLLPEQQREIAKNVRTVVEGRADRFEFEPPHPTMAFSSTAACARHPPSRGTTCTVSSHNAYFTNTTPLNICMIDSHRSTNLALEHTVRRLIEYAYHAGPKWIDAIMGFFNFRWIIEAGRVVGLYDAGVKHYDMQLRDALAAALRALPFKELRVLPKHREVVARTPMLRTGHFYANKILEAVEGGAAAEGGGGAAAAGGAGPAAAVCRQQHQVRRLKPNAADVTALLKSECMGDTLALAHFARARGLLWGEADAIKFIERVVKKEKVLLELVKHNFPALHQRLRMSIVPTRVQAESAAASKVLTSVPEGVPMALSAGDGFQGGAEEVRQPPAPRPSAAAAAAAPPLEDDEYDEEEEGAVEVGAAVAAPAAAGKKRPQKQGAGPRKDMSPDTRARRDAIQARQTAKRRKVVMDRKIAQVALLLSKQ